MIKIIYKNFSKSIIAVLMILISHTFVLADIVKEIKIVGNNRVNVETIKIFGGISVNDNLDANDLNIILKKLYETNFFEKVSIEFDNSILTIKVKENLIIQNIVIKGIKNKDVKKKISELISLKEKNPYLENQTDAEVNRIKNFVQEIGFYFSKVDLLKKENENNTVDLIFDIDLGKKAFINEIILLEIKNLKKESY